MLRVIYDIYQFIITMTDQTSVAVQAILIVVFVVSSVFCSIIPLMYYYFERCRGHPMNLVAIICLLQLVSNYNFLLIALDVYVFEDSVHLKSIFTAITFNFNLSPDEFSFCKLNDGLFVFLEIVIVSFNLFFAVDLFITLRKPFISGAKRQKFYNVIALLVSVVLFAFTVSDLDRQCGTEKGSFQNYSFPNVMAYQMAVFLIIAVGIAAYSTYFLRHTKTPNSTREKYVVHHRRILIALIVCWIFPALNNNEAMRDWAMGYSRNLSLVFQYISFGFLMLTGTFVNLARLSQPHVYANFKDILKSLRKCQCLNKQKQKDEEQTKAIKSDTSDQQNQERREEVSQAWNIPLSEALTEFNNQSVLQNIIQTVIQLSKPTVQQQISNTFKMDESEAERMLDKLQHQTIAQVGKMTKRLELVCVKFQNEVDSIRQKTVFRALSQHSFDSPERMAQQSQQPKANKLINIKAAALSHYIFEKMRQLCNVTYSQLTDSLDVAKNYYSIKATKQSMGASGSFFFFSYDRRFVIKTIDQQDVLSLIELLPRYYKHFMHEPNSLIAKIFGLYTIEIASISKITFILMENAFSTFDNYGLEYRQYDLKGSTMNREVKNPRAPVLKDVNFFKGNQPFIFVTRSQKQQLIRQIEKDIALLSQINIMDYSLLLGVADVPEQLPAIAGGVYNWKYITSGLRINGKVYSLSLIDYLQKFNCQKLAERKYKTFLSTKANEVSSVSPKEYEQRFLKFINTILIVVN